jgi:hypothetical protein
MKETAHFCRRRQQEVAKSVPYGLPILFLIKAMTNKEIRQWYIDQVSTIPRLDQEWLQQGVAVQERAIRAWQIRHDARIRAREMMEVPEEVELLRQRDIKFYGNPDGPSFEYLVRQASARGLQGEEIYQSIINGSLRTDEQVNKKLQ